MLYLRPATEAFPVSFGGSKHNGHEDFGEAK